MEATGIEHIDNGCVDQVEDDEYTIGQFFGFDVGEIRRIGIEEWSAEQRLVATGLEPYDYYKDEPR